MKKNKWKLGLGVLTVLATPIAVNTVASSDALAAQGWVQSGSSWYYYHQGQLVKNAWVGSYWLGTDGKLVTNAWVDNGRYYVGANGVWDKNAKKKEVSKPTVSSVPTRGYANGVYYVDSKPANWWYNDGQAWYFFQNGKKLTGTGQDNAGVHYFVNGKYANGKIGNKEYRDGKEVSVENKVPTRGYANGVYYVDSKPANWWYDDGQAWYFFQNGKKLTGYGQDNAGTHYFVNGKYANGKVGNKEYRDGKEVSKENKVPTRGYANGVYYVDSKPANWWYDDGQAWYFFQNGKKLTGYGQDNAGTHYFVNGKYANGKVGNKEYRDGKEVSKENKVPTRGYANGVYYVDSKPANWWYDDGNDWYFFQNGKKLTGTGKDSAGTHYFVNGKYQQTNLQKVLDVARKYMGVETGTREHKKIVDAYNSVDPKPVGYTATYDDDWCDIFVTTVFQQAGLSDLIGRECGVQRHIGIMEKKGIWKGRTQPKVGDIVTFDWDGGGWADHIGIVESVNNGVITTIEGNSALYAGSTAKTKVNRKTYNWNSRYIKGYARPAY